MVMVLMVMGGGGVDGRMGRRLRCRRQREERRGVLRERARVQGAAAQARTPRRAHRGKAFARKETKGAGPAGGPLQSCPCRACRLLLTNPRAHCTGGLTGLIGAMLCGPRLGRFEDGVGKDIPGHDVSSVSLGSLMLWFGWCVRVRLRGGGSDTRVSGIVLSGAIMALGVSRQRTHIHRALRIRPCVRQPRPTAYRYSCMRSWH